MSSESPAPEPPYFKVPLNLPHAARVAWRIASLLPAPPEPVNAEAEAANRIAQQLTDLLADCFERDENPGGTAALRLRDRAAGLGRRLVGHIEQGGFGGDRLGQCVRNFFECLELGPEGAAISLRAGEDPKSLQRPF